MRCGKSVSALLGAVLAGASALAPAAAETVRVGGTGLVIGLMRALGERVAQARPDIETVVLPSLGTPGGLAALADGAIEVGTAGRTMTAAEQAKGLQEAACAITALTFATSRTGMPNLATRDLPMLFAEPDPRWPDGMPLKIILRARAGSEIPFLSEKVPGMRDAFAAAFKRQGVAVGINDQENADIAQQVAGSLAIITLLQIRTERLALQPLGLDGVAPTPEVLAAGRWPLPMRFCLILPTAPTPGARQLVAHFKSPEGQALLAQSGAVPAE